MTPRWERIVSGPPRCLALMRMRIRKVAAYPVAPSILILRSARRLTRLRALVALNWSHDVLLLSNGMDRRIRQCGQLMSCRVSWKGLYGKSQGGSAWRSARAKALCCALHGRLCRQTQATHLAGVRTF